MRTDSSAGLIVTVVVLALIVGVAGGLGGAYFYLAAQPPIEAPPVDGRPPRVEISTAQDAIVHAVERVDPTVVKIVSTLVQQPDSPFGFFFDGPRVRQGMGSGVIFDYNGRKLVITNTHVLGGAQEILVQTREGEEFRGNLLGADASSDVAVLELEGDVGHLPTATLGDSDALQIGEWVVAIGHPFAFDHTVTVGVVSAQGPRSLGPQGPTRTMIQTDAAINQGNSGGPLTNLTGDVIGINSMIFSPTGATVGIGLAIPINEVKQVVHFLIERGPWLGIETQPNSPGLARYLGLDAEEGLVVLSVVPGSPAANAGLQSGDVLLRIGDREMTGSEDLRQSIFAHQIGDTVQLGIQRGTEQMELEVVAGTVPEGYFR